MSIHTLKEGGFLAININDVNCNRKYLPLIQYLKTYLKKLSYITIEEDITYPSYKTFGKEDKTGSAEDRSSPIILVRRNNQPIDCIAPTLSRAANGQKPQSVASLNKAGKLYTLFNERLASEISKMTLLIDKFHKDIQVNNFSKAGDRLITITSFLSYNTIDLIEFLINKSTHAAIFKQQFHTLREKIAVIKSKPRFEITDKAAYPNLGAASAAGAATAEGIVRRAKRKSDLPLTRENPPVQPNTFFANSLINPPRNLEFNQDAKAGSEQVVFSNQLIN